MPDRSFMQLDPELIKSYFPSQPRRCSAFITMIALNLFGYCFELLVLKEKREVDIAVFSELYRKLASQVIPTLLVSLTYNCSAM